MIRIEVAEAADRTWGYRLRYAGGGGLGGGWYADETAAWRAAAGHLATLVPGQGVGAEGEVQQRLAHAHDTLIHVARYYHRVECHRGEAWTDCHDWPCRDIGREITRRIVAPGGAS